MRFILSFLALVVAGEALACAPSIQQPAYDPATYYASTTNLTGAPLRAALNALTRNHIVYSYSPCTWDMLMQADEDPDNSANVIGFYTRRSIPKTNRDQGGNTPDYWNREHVWPNSHGFPSSGLAAYTDGHALRAADKSVNADRGNKDFADGGTPNAECTACLQTSTTWAPPDVVKGDTARMVFYMDVRYEGGDGTGVGDLTAVDRLTSTGESALGELCDLVNWHLADPVSALETQRNAVIYSWQGNRNPFIDHPEFVLELWGETCGIEIPTEPVTPAESDTDIPLPAWALLSLTGMLGWVLRRQQKG